MVQSMTGFGRGTSTGRGVESVVEVHSVNNRYLDVTVRGGREAALLESHVRNAVRGRLERGKITVTMAFRGETDEEPLADLQKANAYVEALKALQEGLGLPGEIDLSLISGFRDVIGAGAQDRNPEELWGFMQPALEQALEALLEMRRVEGAALAGDLLARFDMLGRSLDSIGELEPGRSRTYADKLKARVEELLDGAALDEERIYQEIALYADRVDISEECTRLRSHIDHARKMMDGSEPAGRQLNFLLQEMHREVNTLGSKANDQEISHLVVGMKEELEKIREQVQNIE